MDINRVQLVGNITRDPEVKRLPSGQEVAKITVATSYSWLDAKSKKRREMSEFHRVVAWGKLSELIKKYLRKGEKILLEGRLVTRTWEVKDVKHYQTEVVASNVVLLSAKKNAEKMEILVEEPDLDDD
jgi:single-strand DNA-binding protein